MSTLEVSPSEFSSDVISKIKIEPAEQIAAVHSGETKSLACVENKGHALWVTIEGQLRSDNAEVECDETLHSKEKGVVKLEKDDCQTSLSNGEMINSNSNRHESAEVHSQGDNNKSLIQEVNFQKSTPSSDTNQDADQEDLSHVCSICGSVCCSEQALRHHIDLHLAKKRECSVCGKVKYSKNTMYKHRKTHRDEKHRCSVCGCVFRSKILLEGHKKSHQYEPANACHVCGKMFSQKGFLHKHLKTHKANEGHGTSGCCEKFTTKEALHDHIKSHHRDEMHGCSECGELFCSKELLDSHALVHE